MSSVAQSRSRQVAFYAFLGDAHGIALRDIVGFVWFLYDDGVRTQLTNDDIPDLVRLGDLDLIEAARLEDEKYGSLAKTIHAQHHEHVRVAA